jgi:hypothetical protein
MLALTRHAWMRAWLVVLALQLGGCSIISPWSLWELTKATGAAATQAIGQGDGRASNTVAHEPKPVDSMCIEYNPRVPVEDIVPALQIALREHKVESRVYEAGGGPLQCEVWLRYSAYIDWGLPPFSTTYTPFISNASLTLYGANGQVLASSQYQVSDPFGRSRWATTHDKLAPVIAALLTGRDDGGKQPNRRSPKASKNGPGKTL